MANKNQKRNAQKGESPDPYLRAFLRQAVAIITVERGLNETSRSKLRSLADQLGLADETFQRAIEQLKRPDASVGLNRYEKEFVAKISSEFERISGDVLNVRAEQRLLDLAESTYQINTIRAHQLIQKSAQQFNVGTISHADAEQFAVQLIEENLRNQTNISQFEIERLCKACGKWGMDRSDFDHFLASTLTRNRWAQRRSWIRNGILIMSIFGCLIAVGYSASFFDWKKLFHIQAKSVNNDESELLSDSIDYPVWWDATVIAAAQKLAQQGKREFNTIKQLAAEDAEQTANLYRKLLAEKLSASESDMYFTKFIAAIYRLTPEAETAQAILSTIKDCIRLEPDNPASPSQIRRSTAATRLFASILYDDKSKAPQRRRQLKKLNEEFYSANAQSSAEKFLSAAVENLTLDQWAHALRHCQQHPRAVAAMLQELENRELSNNFAINEIRTEVVQSIILAAPVQWQTIRNSIQTSIANSNQVLRESWNKFAAQVQTPALREFLKQQLLKHTNTIANIDSQRKLNAQLLQNKIALDLNLRQLDIKLQSHGILPGGVSVELCNDPQRLSSLLFNLTRTNNLLVAWIQDFNLQSDPPQLYALEYDKGNLQFTTSGQTVDKSPTASEIRKLTSMFENLFNSLPGQTSSRVSALEEIGQLASRFNDIEYPAAVKFNEYWLNPTSDREALAIERLLPQLSHWVNLKMALADGLPKLSENRERLVDSLELLQIEDQIDLNKANWDRELQQALLLHCTKILAGRNACHFKSWQQLEPLLQTLQRSRIEMITRQVDSNFANKSLLQEWISSNFNEARILRRELNIIYDHEVELERTIALKKMIARLFFQSAGKTIKFLNSSDNRIGQELLNVELYFYRSLNEYYREIANDQL